MKREEREDSILKFLAAHPDKAYTAVEIAQSLKDNKCTVKTTIAKLHRQERVGSLISEHAPTYYYAYKGGQNGQTKITTITEESQ